MRGILTTLKITSCMYSLPAQKKNIYSFSAFLCSSSIQTFAKFKQLVKLHIKPKLFFGVELGNALFPKHVFNHWFLWENFALWKQE